MKRVLTLALCGALTTGCSAQPDRVDVAYTLYRGCVAATFPYQYPYPTTKAATKVYVESLDQYCINWTGVWLPTLTEEQTDLSSQEEARFNNLRMKVVNEVLETIVLANSKPLKQ